MLCSNPPPASFKYRFPDTKLCSQSKTSDVTAYVVVSNVYRRDILFLFGDVPACSLNGKCYSYLLPVGRENDK
ncbi:hypothetical protein [Dysgonomonas sp.]